MNHPLRYPHSWKPPLPICHQRFFQGRRLQWHPITSSRDSPRETTGAALRIARRESFSNCGKYICYSLYGYGSIPISTIFNGMNIHLPAILMFTRGTGFWHTAICCGGDDDDCDSCGNTLQDPASCVRCQADYPTSMWTERLQWPTRWALDSDSKPSNLYTYKSKM